MKKLMVLLMTFAFLFVMTATAFASGSPVTPPSPEPTEDVVIDDVYEEEDYVVVTPAPTPTPAPTAAPTAEPVVEPVVEAVEIEDNIVVEAAVTSDGVELKAEEIKVGGVADVEKLAEENPVVAEKVEETQKAVAELAKAVAAEPEKKEEAVAAYFEEKGEAVVTAISAAIEACDSVTSLADITPVPVAKPVEVAMTGSSLEAVMAAFENGGTVELTIPVPEALQTLDLKEDSFICAELVDADGNVHIVTFKIVNGKMVGNFPALGHISNFWVGTAAATGTEGTAQAPQTSNTNLEGVMVCGALACAAVLLFSVKRIKRV